jgi:hypothetical protein
VHFVLSSQAHIQRLLFSTLKNIQRLRAFNAEDMCGSATMFAGLIAMARRQKMFEPVAEPPMSTVEGRPAVPSRCREFSL